MMAQYVNTLEGDKRTLRAQVKRLASENNWLRKELAEHQHLLQETEIQLARLKEEKEQLEFTVSNQKVRERGRERGGERWGGNESEERGKWLVLMLLATTLKISHIVNCVYVVLFVCVCVHLCVVCLLCVCPG